MRMKESPVATGAHAALEELERIAPGAPLLALGQTIFWDEPMKAGLAQALRRNGFNRRFIAGVHDTDYFAKLSSGRKQPGRFRSFPHNDTTTRGLWSAAGEFSSLFGSETVVTREKLARGGLRLDRLAHARPNFLDEATEAWGWRGIVSLDDDAPVAAEVPMRQVQKELFAALDWALNASTDLIAGAGKETAERLADDLRTLLCDARDEDENQSLAAFYERLLPDLYRFCSSSSVNVDTERTSRLLKFNRSTATSLRFRLAALFIDHRSRETARTAYDDAVHGSGIFNLARFGTGAIPFDLYIPGIGRGTVRIGTRGIVINTPRPQFLSLKKPLESIEDFASAVESKFGLDCVLVGKAVTLIGMLAAEHVFVFHEGASSYVSRSRELHRLLRDRIGGLPQLNPILRVKYETWSSMTVCCSWLRMPEPFQRAFGTEELCAPSFAQRWRGVVDEQSHLLEQLGELRRPVDLIDFLEATLGGQWSMQAEEYRSLHKSLDGFLTKLAELHRLRAENYEKHGRLKRERLAAEIAKGEHFRAKILAKFPTPDEQKERTCLAAEVDRIIGDIEICRETARTLERDQRELVHGDDVIRVHDRRNSIEIEAELKRLRLIREAVITSNGLPRANHRPSAWWFRLVCPDGLWFRETVDTAEYYLEPLT